LSVLFGVFGLGSSERGSLPDLTQALCIFDNHCLDMPIFLAALAILLLHSK